MEKFVLNNIYEIEDITLYDVIKWIEKEFGTVWNEYVGAGGLINDPHRIKFSDICPNGSICYCQFGSNEGIYLTIGDAKTRHTVITGKTLETSDNKWHECCHTLARIGLELREIC